MQILLLKSIPSVGNAGEIIEASEGYARNFLLKGGKGKVATAQEIATFNSQKKKQAKEKRKEVDETNRLYNAIQGKTLRIGVPAKDGDKLYASVSEADLALAIKKQLGVAVQASEIKVKAAIKTVGSHQISLKVKGKRASCTVIVS